MNDDETVRVQLQTERARLPFYKWKGRVRTALWREMINNHYASPFSSLLRKLRRYCCAEAGQSGPIEGPFIGFWTQTEGLIES